MKNILKSLIIILAVAAAATGSTSAYFTDTAKIENNQIQTGTIKLKIDELVNKPVVIDNMAPGESTSGSFAIKNDGTLPQEQFFYLENLVPDDTTLEDNLFIEVKRLKVGLYDCEESEYSLIYSGKLSGIVGESNAQKISDNSSIATSSTIDDEVDNIDAGLWGGKMCQTISLPQDAPDESQGKSLTFDEIVKATQDINPDLLPTP
ncbi:MAG: Spore coat protein [Berkelbacteria bacterium GW2011_GWA2_38_9]|uniref:Spore coat protein n=1 Tax=Berkelbacteria bacterium GW2011_GWA2_38_9 TaxID=1618334 RepID=A0A0G0LJA6_9BACT|nr:MAG: Spore coat protein [Berkelbacteria bacterium GW2011_GWA2_38_9]